MEKASDEQKGCDVVPGSPLTTKTTAVPAKDPLSSVGINGRESEGETKKKEELVRCGRRGVGYAFHCFEYFSAPLANGWACWRWALN